MSSKVIPRRLVLLAAVVACAVCMAIVAVPGVSVAKGGKPGNGIAVPCPRAQHTVQIDTQQVKTAKAAVKKAKKKVAKATRKLRKTHGTNARAKAKKKLKTTKHKLKKAKQKLKTAKRDLAAAQREQTLSCGG